MEYNNDDPIDVLKFNLKNNKEMICDFALSYIEHLENELEKLTVTHSSTQFNASFKIGDEVWYKFEWYKIIFVDEKKKVANIECCRNGYIYKEVPFEDITPESV